MARCMQEGEQGAELDRLTTPAEIEQAAIVRVAGFLGVSRCYFAHIEDGRTATVQHDYRGEGISESLLIAEHPLKEYISPEDVELFLRGETLVVDDVLEDPRTSPRRALPWDADFFVEIHPYAGSRAQLYDFGLVKSD